MDDKFLHELREAPRPAFAQSLRDRLRAQERAEAERGTPPWRSAPVLAGAFAALVAVALFTMPSVRASAQSMLDLFRVRRFAAVKFDETRLDKLRALRQENAFLVFDRVETLREPGPPQVFTTVEAAGAAAGIAPRKPTFLPRGLMLDSVFVNGAGEARFSITEGKLRAMLDQLDLRDVSVPSGLDGQWVQVRKPPVVIQQFRSDKFRAGLAQAVSPEVSVPTGIDVARLAEVGLRVLGLDAGEARRIAMATDWRSTLLVPVPMNVSSFNPVTIRGEQGLLITTASPPSEPGGERKREGTIVLWAAEDRVFGLISNLRSEEAVQMAESLQ